MKSDLKSILYLFVPHLKPTTITFYFTHSLFFLSLIGSSFSIQNTIPYMGWFWKFSFLLLEEFNEKY